MKKTRFLIVLLCFCMLLPIFAACGKTDDPVDSGEKYRYDDLTRETAADSIPDDYDLAGETICILYTNSEKISINIAFVKGPDGEQLEFFKEV